MDSDVIATYAGPALIGAGILLLLVVVLRPGTMATDQRVPLMFADDEPYPGLGAVFVRRLPVGAERVLAGLTEVTPDPRNTRPITTTNPQPSRVATPYGDPDTGLIRILGREAVQRAVPDQSVNQHPARRPA
jgi:hypothetical protein